MMLHRTDCPFSEVGGGGDDVVINLVKIYLLGLKYTVERKIWRVGIVGDRKLWVDSR
jgi:hypothetical protein